MIIGRDHPAVIQPDEDDIVWRYLSLDKFESSINRNGLFFCRPDRFSDPFEGSLPKEEAAYRIKSQQSNLRFYNNTLDKDAIDKNDKAFAETHKMFKRTSIVNCWHINENESDGMWRLYLKSNEGVTIKSTVAKIIKSFENTIEEIFISKVRYINYDKDIWFHERDYPSISYNFLTPIVHKRIEFSQETELRLIHNISDAVRDEEFWIKQEFEKGLFITVDMEMLVDEIVLPPTSDSYVEDKVNQILAKYRLNKIVRKSRLSSEPLY